MVLYALPEYVLHIFGIIIALLVCTQLLSIFLHQIQKIPTVNSWLLLFCDAAYRPVQLGIWIFGIFMLYEQIHYLYTDNLIFKHIEQLRQAAYSLTFCWFLFRIKNRFEKFIVAQQEQYGKMFDPMLILIVSQISRVVIIGLVGVILLYLLGIPFQSLMMFQGAISIALGFAAQNVLGNGFGGIMILINQPFKVGDLISSPDKKIEGYVEEIRWDSTKIMNLDRRPLYVPNSIFTQIIIVNASHMYNRHILQIINLRYEDVAVVDAITSDIEAMLKLRDDIDHKQVFAANWVGFGPHALRIEVSAFTTTINRVLFRKIQQDVCVQIAAIITKHEAKIAIVSPLEH